MIIVSDASPLIALGRIGRLDLLNEIFGSLVLPDAVWREVVEAGIDKEGAAKVAVSPWISRRSVRDKSLVDLLRHDLCAGEAEAIVLAKECNADFLLIDERLGRSAAKSLGLKIVGLVGVLIEVRERGLVTDPGSLMNRLHNEAGFWISEELRKQVTG
jgi:predicted nucleic acid-binding protein